MCVGAFVDVCVSARAADRFLQAFVSSGENSRYLDFAFHQVCATGMSNANKFSRQNTVSFCLIYLASRIFFLTFLFLSPSSLLRSKNSLPLPSPQMLPSSTSSTARPPRTLRSCVRPALMSSLLAGRPPSPPLLHPLPLADLFRPCHSLSSTPTPCPTQAPSPASKVCLSPSPQELKAGLPPHASPYLSASRPHCGGSCRPSGTAPSSTSSPKTRDAYKRYCTQDLKKVHKSTEGRKGFALRFP